MALNGIENSSFAGKDAGEYISASLLNANSIFEGGVTIRPNVKYKEVLQKLDSSGLMADGSCDFTDAGDVTIQERILEPKELQVNSQFCKTPFVADWESMSMGASAHQNMPKRFADYIIGHYAAKVAEATEISLWAGDASNDGEFDGYITLLNSEASFTGTSRNVSGTAVTASNVIDELGKVVDQIGQAVYTKEDLSIYVAPNVARAYVRALGGFGAAGLGAAGTDSKGTQWFTNGALTFDGIKIFVANGMPANTMIAAEKSNLYFGTGLLSDYNEVRLIDMAPIDGSQNLRFVMRMTAGVQIGNLEDIVAYGI